VLQKKRLVFGDKHMAQVVAAASRAHGSGGAAASTGAGGTEEADGSVGGGDSASGTPADGDEDAPSGTSCAASLRCDALMIRKWVHTMSRLDAVRPAALRRRTRHLQQKCCFSSRCCTLRSIQPPA
jgi:hypothetical protein